MGPIYTYMAYCPNGRDCSDFNGTSGNHWFKIGVFSCSRFEPDYLYKDGTDGFA